MNQVALDVALEGDGVDYKEESSVRWEPSCEWPNGWEPECLITQKIGKLTVCLEYSWRRHDQTDSQVHHQGPGHNPPYIR